MIPITSCHNFQGQLQALGLTEDETRDIERQCKTFNLPGNEIFTAEFLMFFVSWARQGRSIALKNIIRVWTDLWSTWYTQAPLCGIDPWKSHPYHARLIEKLYSRFPVTYEPQPQLSLQTTP